MTHRLRPFSGYFQLFSSLGAISILYFTKPFHNCTRIVFYLITLYRYFYYSLLSELLRCCQSPMLASTPSAALHLQPRPASLLLRHADTPVSKCRNFWIQFQKLFSNQDFWDIISKEFCEKLERKVFSNFELMPKRDDYTPSYGSGRGYRHETD